MTMRSTATRQRFFFLSFGDFRDNALSQFGTAEIEMAPVRSQIRLKSCLETLACSVQLISLRE